MALMRADLNLKQRQGFWETPRNLVIVVGALVAVLGTVAGMAGYKFGANLANQQQEPERMSLVLPPGTTIQVPPASRQPH